MLFRSYSEKLLQRDFERDDKYFNRLKDIMDFIDENHAYGISTAVIAEKFGYNPDYMARFFKKYMNCTVTDYIYLVRIGYVHRALVNTNDSVADIFERHGCTNHHLSMKYFRNQYGCTPREHRKKEQSKYKT